MNIFELSEKSGISVKKLRVLDKLKGLRHDGSATALDAISEAIRVGNRLSVGQLVYLLDNPGDVFSLNKSYAGKAREQIDAIGNAKAEVAPAEVSARILDAFEKQPEAVAAIIAWAKTIIPARPVGHAYVASRLLLGVPKNGREHDIPRLQRVMMNCRDHPDFAGWWKKEKVGSRNRTVYQKLSLDL